MFDVSLLGTGGMMPMPNRYLTALLLRENGHLFLVDCGEGTQVSMRELGWGFKNIEVICFTHYHADHIAGLPGLLLTMANAGKTEPLTILGPPGLKNVINGLTTITPELTYPIHLLECPPHKKEPIDILGITISYVPVRHNTTCLAYSFQLERKRKFDIERAKELPIPPHLYKHLQNGEKIMHDGVAYYPDQVLGEERKGIKIAYCTDSRPTDRLTSFVKEADLFVCEGMYGDYEFIERAKKYMHMIFLEAAEIAKEAHVKELWLTHFSPAFLDPENYIDQAREIFKNAHVGVAHKIKNIGFPE